MKEVLDILKRLPLNSRVPFGNVKIDNLFKKINQLNSDLKDEVHNRTQITLEENHKGEVIFYRLNEPDFDWIEKRLEHFKTRSANKIESKNR